MSKATVQSPDVLRRKLVSGDLLLGASLVGRAVVTVYSLAELGNFEGVYDRQRVDVVLTGADGGFTVYWDAASLATVDDKTIFSGGVVTGRWIRDEKSLVVNVPSSLAFGLKTGSGNINIASTTVENFPQSQLAGAVNFLSKRRRMQFFEKPADFPWEPDFLVWSDKEGNIKTDLDVANYRVIGDGSFEYVDPVLGNEANDGLTWATAKRDPAAAIHTRTAATIYIAPGTYHRSDFHDWGVNKISRDVSIICPNGIAIVTRRAGGASLPAFTLSSGTTYVVARNNIASVYDVLKLDIYDDYTKMPAYASLALLNAAPFGYFRDGANTYVKRADGAVPTYLNTAIFLVEDQPVSGITGNATVYLENLHFEGGTSCFDIDPTSSTDVMKLYAKGCSFKYNTGSGGGGDGLSVFGATEVRLQGSEGSRTWNDVVSYHEDTVTSPGVLGLAVEVDCVWRRAGWDNLPSTNNNGSTAHDGWTVVRINTEQYLNGGPNVADVTGCNTWMVGCKMHDGIGTGSVSGVQCGNGEMWLDVCEIYNNQNGVAMLANDAGTIHLRDSYIDGVMQANGGTTIDSY